MINDFSPYKLAGGRITQKRPSTDLFHNNGTYDFGGIVDGYQPTIAPPGTLFEGFVTQDSLGDSYEIFGVAEVGPGVFFDIGVIQMRPGSIGAAFFIADAAGEDVVTLNSFDGIILGSSSVDTATGRRIYIDDGTGAARFQVDGTNGNIFTIGTYVGGDINATTVAPNDIGTAGQTTFYGDGSNLTGIAGNDLLFDATVSDTPGADYPTVAAAILAGERRLYLYDIITETSNSIVLLGNYVIYLEKGSNWDHGDFFMNLGGVADVEIIGYGQESWASTTGTPLWSISAGSNINLDGPSLRNQSTVSGSTYTTSTVQINIQDCYFVLPNLTGFNGFVTATGNANNYLNNVTFSGGGASSGCALSLGQGSATNITLVDDFSTTNSAIIVGDRGQITNLLAHTNTQAEITISGGQIENYLSHGAAHPNFVAGASFGMLTNAQMGDGDFDLATFGGMKLTNCASDGLLDMSDVNCTENFITSCKFDDNITIGGNSNEFVSFRTDGTFTMSGQQNKVTGGQTNALSITGSFNHINNLDMPFAATSSVTGAANQVENSYFGGGLNVQTASGNTVSNCYVVGASVVTSAKNRISNSIYVANSAVALSITADDNSVMGCQVGQDAGGGIGTITIGAGAARVSVTACHTDAAIIDNNGGAGLSNNFIY